jgi:hypothetical protein
MGSFQSLATMGSQNQSGRIGLPNRRPSINSVGKQASFFESGAPSLDDAWEPYLIKRGTYYNEYRITSGPDIQKVPGRGGSEIWGKYPKIYSSIAGLNAAIFYPPVYLYVDNVRVLCPCADIPNRLNYDQETRGGDNLLKLKILSGEIIPACWEDYKSVFNMYGDKTFDVFVRHPAFYANIVTDNPYISDAASIFGIFKGGLSKGRKGKSKSKNKGRKRKTRRRRN